MAKHPWYICGDNESKGASRDKPPFLSGNCVRQTGRRETIDCILTHTHTDWSRHKLPSWWVHVRYGHKCWIGCWCWVDGRYGRPSTYTLSHTLGSIIEGLCRRSSTFVFSFRWTQSDTLAPNCWYKHTHTHTADHHRQSKALLGSEMTTLFTLPATTLDTSHRSNANGCQRSYLVFGTTWTCAIKIR